MTKIIAQHLIQAMCFLVYSMEKSVIDPSLVDREDFDSDDIIRAHSRGAVAGQYTLIDTLHHQGLIAHDDHTNAHTAFDLAREIAHNHMDEGRHSGVSFQAFWDDMMHEIRTREAAEDDDNGNDLPVPEEEETNHVTGE